MPVGGDIKEITYNHPTIGSGSFYPKSEEDSTLDPGGYRSEDDDAGVDGGGNMIDILTQKRWSAEATISWDMNNKKEDKILARLAADPLPAQWTFSHISGIVFAGTGKPVGDIKPNAGTATIPIKISGGGKLTEI